MPRTYSTNAICLLAVTGLALTASHPATAQDALGDGTALDNNLRVGSDGRNPRSQNLRRDLDYRNAIVTGNVPGGFAFRGDVGYTASNDFRGSTGADDLFEFQRDAFYSGLATRGLSGISSLQSSLAYPVTGQSSGLTGGLIINRPSVGTSAADLTPNPNRIDIFATIDGGLRAPSAITLQDIERPAFLNVATDASGTTRGYIGASDLLGVRVLPAQNSVYGSADPTREQELLRRLREDPTLSTPPPTDDEEPTGPDLRLPTHTQLLESLGLPTRIEDTIDVRIEDEVEQPGLAPQPQFGGDPLGPLREALREADDRNNPMNRLTPRVPTASDDFTNTPEGDGEGEPKAPETLEERLQRAVESARDTLGRSIDIDELRVSSNDPAFARHFERGVELLEAGRYFDAEERFAAALQLVPGDAMAAIGRLHAQIGAGMFLSAGANLRRLLVAYPEFVTARLDERFLPTGERLEETRELLRLRMNQAFMLNRDAALLLAYLGVQTGEPADVEDGIARFRELAEGESAADDAIVLLLEEAWLARDASDAAPDGGTP